MKLSLPTFSILGVVTSIITLTTASPKLGCGNQPSDETVRQTEANFQANGNLKIPTAVTLGVYFHVISKDNTLRGGNIPDDQIKKQIDVLNQDFSQIGVSFRLIAIDRTVNPDWFNIVGGMGASQAQMKQALRKGGAADVNIFTVGSITDDSIPYRGYSTFPWEFSQNPTTDGVIILFASLPGGSLKLYDLGHTATHEVGHWGGLYHTFQGGCTPPGDVVDDTTYQASPYQASPSFGCQNRRDTCPAWPGIDPTYNFMDISDDACVTQFTPGQSRRFVTALVQFRGVR